MSQQSKQWRHDLRIGLISAALATLVAAPSAAVAAYVANADKVDNKHAVGAGASTSARAGKLVATSSGGRLPNNIIAKAPDSAMLGGKTLRETQMQWISVAADGSIQQRSSGAGGVTVSRPRAGTYCVSPDNIIRASMSGTLRGPATSLGPAYLYIPSYEAYSSCPDTFPVITFISGPTQVDRAFTLHFAMTD